jgi:hypothetical protein
MLLQKPAAGPTPPQALVYEKVIGPVEAFRKWKRERASGLARLCKEFLVGSEHRANEEKFRDVPGRESSAFVGFWCIVHTALHGEKVGS